jgi:hypothetical protein
MRRRLLITGFGFSLLGAATAAALTIAAHRSTSQPVLSCAGVSVRLPAGLHGRVRPGNGGVFTLTLATFSLVAETDAVDERSAERMTAGDVLVLLIGYGRGQASNPAFRTHAQLPLTVQRMKVYSRFEHLQPGHRLARTMFIARGAAYDVRVQFASPLDPFLRREANGVLRLLDFGDPSQQEPNRRTRC